MPFSPRARVLVVAALLFASLAALVWYLSAAYGTRPVTPIALPSPGASGEGVAPATPTATPTPATTETPAATPATEATATPAATPTPAAATPQAQGQPGVTSPVVPSQATPPPSPSGLIIPVAGVRPEQLQNTFDDARSEGRRHDAIDIIAPRGTPVLAATDGRVLSLFRSDRGGITLYQLGTDERTVYYYAHLDAYADGMTEGRVLRRGETLGFVGDTGNATPGNCHLHFQVYRVTDPKKFWAGDNLNPYDLLR